ncbi:MAG: phosphoribosylamine--glycine ligase [Gammaproteobacteria bacterium]|nr:phosphoribosylamine--glycine ligase [Gammaproteobacteria bacterium]
MNILLIGSGAREHAIARAIKRSPQDSQIACFASHNNPGIMPLCNAYCIGSMQDSKAMLDFAKQNRIDFAIIGPEIPLSLGIVDCLKAIGIAAIGPTRRLAQIETSKGLAREVLSKYQLPGIPLYQRFNQACPQAERFLHQLGEHYVIKADGLMGGKGVKLSGEHLVNHSQALAFIDEIDGPFVIEEKVVGPEFSLLSFSDGRHCIHMPAVQDHKRAFIGDTGPNTGGMGSYSDADHSLPFLSQQDIDDAAAMNERAIQAMQKEWGEPYKGILYGGFMKTKTGIKLIEYNARFGDPEAINLLALLDSDFIDICQGIIEGRLDKVKAQFLAQASVCKYIVPEGYPDQPSKGQVIDISQVTKLDRLYYAAVDQLDDRLIMTGSRAIAVLGVGDTLAQAEQQAEILANQIKGRVYHRPDIGTEQLINQRIDLVSTIMQG